MTDIRLANMDRAYRTNTGQIVGVNYFPDGRNMALFDAQGEFQHITGFGQLEKFLAVWGLRIVEEIDLGGEADKLA